MCELLGMSCNVPTDITFSFHALARRSDALNHPDGWGLALYEGRVPRVFLESSPCASSPLAKFVKDHPIKTLCAVAHVRRKTRGPVSLANTHPFARELWGRHFVFAHNGTVKKLDRLKLGRFTPVGKTDSEYAFCALLGALESDFRSGAPDKAALAAAVAGHAGEIGSVGTFNMLLADGDQLFARCATKLHYIVRQAPFRRATLADDDVTIDFAAVTTPKDRVAIVATLPLTRDETWTTGEPGAMWVFAKGRVTSILPSAR